MLISKAGNALRLAASERDRMFAVSADALPTMPAEKLELATLKAYADSVDASIYRGFSDIEIGGFNVTLQTPAQTFVALKAHENIIARDRKRREDKSGIKPEERYSEVREYRDWSEYVGVSTTPVVAISVIPRVGETGGSLFARIVISANMQATYKFLGDVRGVEVLRNGAPVTPIKGGHAPMKVWVDNRWVSLKDVADQGYYVFDAELLRPDSAGTPPSIIVMIKDLKSPKYLKCRELPFKVVARAWNDFKAFYLDTRPGLTFGFANPATRPAREGPMAYPALRGPCNWSPY